ncbi:hypothetical protein [Ornithinimicrobium tianjinense]|uniref:Uncharacterized protein n=1 Tax=Ornithinimicrobium tianjinense TaxID=1195761 RepID=A0A917F5E9_9MICO|nr:hypothetical protein [Ornithinimicrobium tianjinense]GGF51743.1 hypothetical protein GCM10011366_19510 [Ornithinimicrobium tianjinense]
MSVRRLDHAELERTARVLDDLGARRHPAGGSDDPLLAALADWTTAIDTATSSGVIRPARAGARRLAPVTPLAPATVRRGGRHRVVRRAVGGSLLTAMALAGSSVAAALSGGQVPVLSGLGTVLVDAVPMLDAPVDVGVPVSPPRVDATGGGGPVSAPVDGSAPLAVDLSSLSTPATADAPTADAPTADAPTADAPIAVAPGAARPRAGSAVHRDELAPPRAPGAGQGAALGLPRAPGDGAPPAHGRPLVPPQSWLSPPPGLGDRAGDEVAKGGADRPGRAVGASHGRTGGRAEAVRQSGERGGKGVERPGRPSPVDQPEPPATRPANTPCAAAPGEPPRSGPRDDMAPPAGPPVETGPPCEAGPATDPPAETSPPADAEPPVVVPPSDPAQPAPPTATEPPADPAPPAAEEPAPPADAEPPADPAPPAVPEPPAETEDPPPAVGSP